MEQQEINEFKAKLKETEEQLQKEQALSTGLKEELTTLKGEREKELAEGTEETLNEARLKNEAYAFIIGQGLLDKFLNSKLRNDKESIEQAFNFLFIETNPLDDWLISI